LNFIFGTVCLYVCVCTFSLRRESPNMILGDKPLISEVVLSHNTSATGMGYSSFGVAMFRFQKSTHTLILPVFFFLTGTMLDTHLAYQHGHMNFACNSMSISSFTLLMISRLKFLVDCLYGLNPCFISKRCSTNSRP
jgi:hypothetical protein